MKRILSILCSLLFLHVGCAQPEAHERAAWSMPSQADVIHLNWVNGPPQLQAFLKVDKHLAGFRDADALLGFRSGKWGMVLDPRSMQLNALTVQKTEDPIAELLEYTALQAEWPQAELELLVDVGGQQYRARGGPIQAKNRKYSPIHIVESGDWFQHVVIYDLELVNAGGELLAGKGRLEIRAWGDRCLFEWVVDLEGTQAVETQIRVRSSEAGAEQSAQSSTDQVQLALDFSKGKVDALVADTSGVEITAQSLNDYSIGEANITYSEKTDSWQVKVPRQKWPKDPDGLAYNKDLLDRISNHDLKIKNTSDQPKELRLRFIHDYHSISGYVPMMLDAEGQQTGLPLQNSKNWHSLPDEPYPYEGSWINISTRLVLEPNAEVDWRYCVVHALWQELPVCSTAQLSLIGWGFNGFWTQMALGSWGETLCLQPGRTMRRAFVTDVRPYMVTGAQGKPYDWTNNVGGSDIAKLVDAEGKLITWQGAVREYEMIGPNLSHVRVTERSEQERMRLQIDTYLARSNSINRSYFKVKLEALEDVALQECVLFQLGSDYYNEMDSQKIAWGDHNGLSDEASPAASEWGVVMDPIELEGSQTWISLHDNNPETKTRGRAVRGLVLREYCAQLDGKRYDTPWLQAARTKARLNAELLPAKDLKELKAGDVIEFTLEMDIFPMSAEVYYGSDASLAERLKATPDSWELVAYESAHQFVRIDGSDTVFPASVSYQGKKRQEFTVNSLSRMDVICVTGLPHPDRWRLAELVDGELVALGDRYAVEAKPQLTYRPESNTWTAVFSALFSEVESTRTFVIQRQ